MVTNSTPERIAAALALAEAVDAHSAMMRWHEDSGGTELYNAVTKALATYRAAAPKPVRTRAEVDAAIAEQVRLYVEARGIQSDECAVTLRGLCAERTMADAIRERIRPTQDSGPSSEETSSPRVAATGAANSDEEEAAIQAADHEDDQCGCDESERLNGYLKDIKALHRVWSDNGADPFQTLTCVGHVLMRWMSNEP